MFLKLGAVCSCCGEAQKRFLTLDHIKNDGYLERKTSYGHSLTKAQKTGWDKKKYQVLCSNCNLGKSLNGGICPHQQISTVNV